MSERGNATLRWLDKWIGIPLVLGISAFRRRRPVPRRISKIGLVILGGSGDFFLSIGTAVPAIRACCGDCHVTVFTSPSNKGAVSLVAGIDEYVVLPLTNIATSLRLVRASRFDLLVDFGHWARVSALLVALSRAGCTAGFRTPGQLRHFAFDLVCEHRSDRHEVENYRALQCLIGLIPPRRPKIELDAAACRKVTQFRLGRYVVFHPWASGIKNWMREWPIQSWRELASRYLARGYFVVFTGGPLDRGQSGTLVSEIDDPDNRLRDFAGRLLFSETAALLDGAAGVVSVNTGVMHLAAARDVPLVALHGPTDPRRWGPLSPCSAVLLPDTQDVAYLDLGFEYPKDAKPCMSLIAVDAVDDALTRVIGMAET